MGQLAEDARALVHATADVAGDKIGEIRKRLSVALDRETKMYGRVCDRVRDRALEGTKAANDAVHDHPYQAIAISIGIGALIGYLVTRPFICSRVS